jgi:CBS domain-containing protein
MSRPPVVIGPDEDVSEAAGTMTEKGIGCLPVVDDGRLVGIITRTDLIREQVPRVVELRGAKNARVRDVMKRDPLTTAADDHLLDAAARMEKAGVRHLPVVDGDNRVIGMLSDRDVRTALGDPLRSLEVQEAVVRIQSTRVSDAMSRRPLVVSDDAPLADALGMFIDRHVGALPVVSGHAGGRGYDAAPGPLVGILSYVDVLRAVANAQHAR